MTLPADRCIRTFFGFGDEVWRHSMLCRFHSGSEKCTQVSSPVTIRCRNASPSASYRRRSSWQASTRLSFISGVNRLVTHLAHTFQNFSSSWMMWWADPTWCHLLDCDAPVFAYHILHGWNVVFRDCRECWTQARRILHTGDAILELLSPFIHLWTTHTPVTVLNSHPTINFYRFHAFAKQKSHNTSLLLLSALLQRHCHLVELFPRFLCVLQACQRHVFVAQGHCLRIPYTQW